MFRIWRAPPRTPRRTAAAAPRPRPAANHSSPITHMLFQLHPAARQDKTIIMQLSGARVSTLFFRYSNFVQTSRGISQQCGRIGFNTTAEYDIKCTYIIGEFWQ